MTPAPTITLKSGLRVANFSSPHPFVFDDGSELPACSNERTVGLMLIANEVEQPSPLGFGLTDIAVSFDMSAGVFAELVVLSKDETVDLILVPLPVMQAVRAGGLTEQFRKIRTCRVVSRITKTISASRFCR